MPDEFYLAAGTWKKRDEIPDPEITEWLYRVNISVIVGVHCPPTNPEIMRCLRENALDMLEQGGKGGSIDMIDSYELVEIRPMAEEE